LVVTHGQPRTVLRWTKIAGSVRALHVQPMLAPRDYHSTHHENGMFRFDPEVDGERVTFRPYPDCPAIHVTSNALYQHAPDWYRNFELSAEAERGLDCKEDCAAPGTFTFDLSAGPAAMILSTKPIEGMASAQQIADRLFSSEQQRRSKLGPPLARAADAYLVVRGTGKTIVAGYPWFSDWGRDTFISLRGLCLTPGAERREDARQILLQWASVVSEGMLPNRFDESSATPEYNSVDAALWFVIGAHAYLQGKVAADDRARIETAIKAIVDGYRAGTRHGIRADHDGLIACGVPHLQLTWMDAKIGDWVITPRIGKPVEIQALWINALAIAGYTDEAQRLKETFVARFWDASRGQLHDVVDCDHVPNTFDASCRPNQIFAVGGLPKPLLEGEQARAVVDTFERELWTPAGPRSLAPGDPRYAPHYGGGPRDRDSVYHNGTVWPWLAGAFIEAWVRVRGNTAEVKQQARRRFVEPMMERLTIAGMGHIAEICDADFPHKPVGCPFQAWSVAELMRIDGLLG
ncbi:MAG: glycogen debranching enzyme N-terminal domain-containing protein, partial [Deltaproteobacteria bacterium]|nr:glycogen debranching enzyme N-terminal domain-containing protein [Deltaproteobacteria bacterium]